MLLSARGQRLPVPDRAALAAFGDLERTTHDPPVLAAADQDVSVRLLSDHRAVGAGAADDGGRGVFHRTSPKTMTQSGERQRQSAERLTAAYRLVFSSGGCAPSEGAPS
jgi:hypothetical protein